MYAIQQANDLFLEQVQRKVNKALTIRNRFIGFYIAEYEQQGQDRAKYGEQLLKQLADRLKGTKVKGFSFTTLHLCKQLYLTYPQIGQAVTDQLKTIGFQSDRILQTVSEESVQALATPTDLLLSRLSFSHFIELIKVDTSLKRTFYETEAIKRITFDNTHYRIDLVFYHRILKCHILLDLKLGEFIHADAGQMNVYLNYYKENEMQPGDNLPVGIILCAGKNAALAKYATMGLPQQVFVSKYLVNLPSEAELQKIIIEEQQKVH